VSPRARETGRCLATYALAIAAGTLCWAAGVPLPWMAGPVAAVAAASLAGLPVAAWVWGRNVGMVAVGTALGVYFTPEALRQVAAHTPLIAAAVGATLLVACSASLLLSRSAGLDRVTAFFCSMPGGVAEMCMLAQHHGGTPTPIAVAQLLRIVTLVIVLPGAMLAGGVAADAAPLREATLPVATLALLLLAALAATALLARRMRNAWLLVPLAVGMAAALSGLAQAMVPAPLTSAAQVLIGAQLGTALRRRDVLAVRGALPGILLNVALLAGACAAVGAALALFSGHGVATLVLATAPGGVSEMCLTARALGLDVPFVVGFHVLRVFVVLGCTPWLFLALRRLGAIPPVRAASSTVPTEQGKAPI